MSKKSKEEIDRLVRRFIEIEQIFYSGKHNIYEKGQGETYYDSFNRLTLEPVSEWSPQETLHRTWKLYEEAKKIPDDPACAALSFIKREVRETEKKCLNII